MPIAINTGGGQRESTLDKILKGLALANQGIGIAGGLRNYALQGEQLDAAKRQNAGVLTESEIAKAGLQSSPLANVPQKISPLVDGAGPLALDNPLVEGPRFSRRNEYKLKVADGKGGFEERSFVAGDEEQKLLAQESDLRDKFNSNPTTKRTAEISEAMERLKATLSKPGKLGPADMLSIYSLMKIADPGSTVREGEAASAQNAGGVDSRIRNLWNATLTGQKLTPELRKEFMDAAGGLARGQIKAQSVIDDQYSDLAKQSGFQKKNVVAPIADRLNASLNESLKVPKESKPSGLKPINQMTREEKLRELGL